MIRLRTTYPYFRLRLELAGWAPEPSRSGRWKRTVFFSRSIRVPIDKEDAGDVLARVVMGLQRAGFKMPMDSTAILAKDFRQGQQRYKESWENFYPVIPLEKVHRVVKQKALGEIPRSLRDIDARTRAIFQALKSNYRLKKDVKERIWLPDLAQLPPLALRHLYRWYVLKDKDSKLWLKNKQLKWARYRPGDPLSMFIGRLGKTRRSTACDSTQKEWVTSSATKARRKGTSATPADPSPCY